MSSYFRNFPVVDYKFGDENTTSQFQHIGTYIDIIDQVKEYSVYYQTYNIRNGERPEQLSYSLYRNTDYYWTFYLLNDHIRESGWPIRDADVYAKAQKYYPNKVSHVTGVVQKQGLKLYDDGNGVSVVWVPLDELLPMCKSTTFRVGNYVYFKSSKVAGKILAIDQKMGAITHDAMDIRSASVDRTMESISEDDAIKVQADPDYEPIARYETMEITKNYDEFDAPHHYEDANGKWIWPRYEEKYPHAINQQRVSKRVYNDYLNVTDPVDADGNPREDFTALPTNVVYNVEQKTGNPPAGFTYYTPGWHYEYADVSTVNSISNYQRLTELNEKQQIISVIKQDSINQIIAEFNRLLTN